MNIGIDVDGVLADFVSAYQKLIIEITGKDLFEPGDDIHPPCWNWPQYRGYSEKEVAAAWSHIKQSGTFNLDLAPLSGAHYMRFLLPELAKRNHVIYFITARVGLDVKWQTETWLQQHLDLAVPTVLISKEKGLCAAMLGLNFYIDDNYENIASVASQSQNTRGYLLDASYNRFTLPEGATRVSSLFEMFKKEADNL